MLTRLLIGKSGNYYLIDGVALFQYVKQIVSEHAIKEGAGTGKEDAPYTIEGTPSGWLYYTQPEDKFTEPNIYYKIGNRTIVKGRNFRKNHNTIEILGKTHPVYVGAGGQDYITDDAKAQEIEDHREAGNWNDGDAWIKGPGYREYIKLMKAALGNDASKVDDQGWSQTIAKIIRKILDKPNDEIDVTPDGLKPVLAALTATIFLAEPIRIKYTFLFNLMLLDLIEKGIKYGAGYDKDYTWSKVLWHPGDDREGNDNRELDNQTGAYKPQLGGTDKKDNTIRRLELKDHLHFAGGKLPPAGTGTASKQLRKNIDPIKYYTQAQEVSILIRWLCSMASAAEDPLVKGEGYKLYGIQDYRKGDNIMGNIIAMPNEDGNRFIGSIDAIPIPNSIQTLIEDLLRRRLENFDVAKLNKDKKPETITAQKVYAITSKGEPIEYSLNGAAFKTMEPAQKFENTITIRPKQIRNKKFVKWKTNIPNKEEILDKQVTLKKDELGPLDISVRPIFTGDKFRFNLTINSPEGYDKPTIRINPLYRNRTYNLNEAVHFKWVLLPVGLKFTRWEVVAPDDETKNPLISKDDETKNPLVFRMDENIHITAEFEVKKYQFTVQVEPEKSGKVYLNTTEVVNNQPYDFTVSNRTLKAVAPPRYKFKGWSGGIVKTDPSIELPLEVISQPIIAHFALENQCTFTMIKNTSWTDKVEVKINEESILSITDQEFKGSKDVEIGDTVEIKLPKSPQLTWTIKPAKDNSQEGSKPKNRQRTITHVVNDDVTITIQ